MDFQSDDDLELDTLTAKPSEAEEIEAEMDAMLAAAGQEDGVDELEALLGEAMADAKTAQGVKEARAKAKAGYGLSAEDQERVRKWELAKEWLPVANCAIFKRYVCSCGFHSTVFEGLMLEQRHRHSKFANRWTKQDAAQAALPNSTAIRTKTIPMCQRCADSKGFSLVTDLHWKD